MCSSGVVKQNKLYFRRGIFPCVGFFPCARTSIELVLSLPICGVQEPVGNDLSDTPVSSCLNNSTCNMTQPEILFIGEQSTCSVHKVWEEMY